MKSYTIMLQHAKKMLIAEPPRNRPLSNLDKEIQQTLNDAHLPDDIKAKQYYSILNRYMRPKQVKPTNNNNVEAELLESVPIQVKYKAKRLMRIIRNHPEADWNERGELVYRQTTIPNSHIIDLISDILKPSSNSAAPRGWEEFAEVLKSSSVPKELVPNTQRWKYIQKQIEKPTQETRVSSSSSARKTRKKLKWESLE